MAEEKKKKSNFSLDKYKTHASDKRGSVDGWCDGLCEILGKETDEKKKEKAEDKIVKVTTRRIQLGD